MSDKISILPDDTIFSIEMSGHFYKRLQGLLSHLTEGFDIEDIMKVYQAAVEDNVKTPTEFHVQTMLYLCKEVEEVCTKQNLWKEVDAKDISVERDTERLA